MTQQPPVWAEVTALPQYQALTPEEQEQVGRDWVLDMHRYAVENQVPGYTPELLLQEATSAGIIRGDLSYLQEVKENLKSAVRGTVRLLDVPAGFIDTPHTPGMVTRAAQKALSAVAPEAVASIGGKLLEGADYVVSGGPALSAGKAVLSKLGVGSALREAAQSGPAMDPRLPQYWEGGNWDRYTSPAWWATQVEENLPVVAGLAATAVGGGAAGQVLAARAGAGAAGQAVAANVGAAAVSAHSEALMEASDVQRQALAAGADPQRAAQAAADTYARNLPMLAFTQAFQFGSGQVSKTLFSAMADSGLPAVKRILAGLGGTAAGAAGVAMEPEQEVRQNEAQRVALGKAFGNAVAESGMLTPRVVQALAGDNQEDKDAALVALALGFSEPMSGAAEKVGGLPTVKKMVDAFQSWRGIPRLGEEDAAAATAVRHKAQRNAWNHFEVSPDQSGAAAAVAAINATRTRQTGASDRGQQVPAELLPEDAYVQVAPKTPVAKLAEAGARLLGLEPVFVIPTEMRHDSFNGFIDGNRVYLNPTRGDPLLVTVWHEFTHDLAAKDPETYAKVEALVTKHVSGPGRQAYAERYAKRNTVDPDTSEARITSELVADVIGDLSGQQGWYEKLGLKTPELKAFAEHLYRFLGKTLRRFKAGLQGMSGAKDVVSNMEDLIDSLAPIVGEAVEKRQPKETGTADVARAIPQAEPVSPWAPKPQEDVPSGQEMVERAVPAAGTASDATQGYVAAMRLTPLEERQEKPLGAVPETARQQAAREGGEPTRREDIPGEAARMKQHSLANRYAGIRREYRDATGAHRKPGEKATEYEQAARTALERRAKAYGIARDTLSKVIDQVAQRDAEAGRSHAPFAGEEEEGATFSAKVMDEGLKRQLDEGKKLKVYRAMQVIDGKLYPPMSGRVGGAMREPSVLGQWEQAVEDPSRRTAKGTFKLDKANGKTVDARYNPYFHTSTLPLNDQFSEAWKRPNLVTVEVEIPASELSSGYRAEGAADAVGEKAWRSGPVASRLPEGQKRIVILSRYVKPVRVVPDAEVAESLAQTLKDAGLSVPINVVTPTLLEELKKRGVTIGPAKGLRASPKAAEGAQKLIDAHSLDSLDAAYAWMTDDRSHGNEALADAAGRVWRRMFSFSPFAENTPAGGDAVVLRYVEETLAAAEGERTRFSPRSVSKAMRALEAAIGDDGNELLVNWSGADLYEEAVAHRNNGGRDHRDYREAKYRRGEFLNWIMVDAKDDIPDDQEWSALVDRARAAVAATGFVPDPGYVDMVAQWRAKDRSYRTGQQSAFSPKSVTPEQGAAYLAAVEAGDTATAQRMVDAAAKAAGYLIGPVWHGTRGTFNAFRISSGGEYGAGAYFADNENTARMFGSFQPGTGELRVVRAYLRLGNPLVTNSRDKARGLGRKGLLRAGYDGVVGTSASGQKQYVVLDPSQIKSADPVTYDDHGRVIPLSKRFQTESPDIRFSSKWWVQNGKANAVGDHDVKDLVKQYRMTAADLLGVPADTLTGPGVEAARGKLEAAGLTPGEVSVAAASPSDDPRELAIRHLGWIRISDRAAQMHRLTPGAIGELSAGLRQAYGDKVSGQTYEVETLAPRKVYSRVPFHVLEAADPKALRNYDSLPGFFSLKPKYEAAMRERVKAGGPDAKTLRTALSLWDKVQHTAGLFRLNPDKAWLEKNEGGYLWSVDPDLLCQRSEPLDRALAYVKGQLGKQGYSGWMGWELLSRVQQAGEPIPCSQCYRSVAQIAAFDTNQKKYMLGLGGYNGEVARWAREDPEMLRFMQVHGLRHYSSTDAKFEHIPGMIAEALDLRDHGVPMTGYAKRPVLARIFGPGGAYFNLSVGRNEIVGMNRQLANRIRNAYPNIGVVYIAFTEDEVLQAMADPTVDHILPWHGAMHSAWRMRRQLGDENVRNFQAVQSDRVPGPTAKMLKADPQISEEEHGGDMDKYLWIAKQRGYTPRFDEFLVKVQGTSQAGTYMKLVGPEYGKFGGAYPYQAFDGKMDLSRATLQQGLDERVEEIRAVDASDTLSIAKQLVEDIRNKTIDEAKADAQFMSFMQQHSGPAELTPTGEVAPAQASVKNPQVDRMLALARNPQTPTARPDLARQSGTPEAQAIQNAVDAVRKEAGLPVAGSVEEWDKEASDWIAASGGPERAADEIIAGRADLENSVIGRAGVQLMTELNTRAFKSTDKAFQARVFDLNSAFREHGHAMGQALRALRASDTGLGRSVARTVAAINGMFLDPPREVRRQIDRETRGMSPEDRRKYVAKHMDGLLERRKQVASVLRSEYGIDIDNLTPEDVSDIRKMATIKRVLETMSSSYDDWLTELWYNWGLLSSLTTHGRNVVGNLANIVTEAFPQRAVETLVSAAAGNPSGAATFGEFRTLFGAYAPSLTEAWRKAAQAFSTEIPAREQRMEIRTKGMAIPGEAGRIARLPGRALLFEDSFFYSVAQQLWAPAYAYRHATQTLGIDPANAPALAEAMKKALADPGSYANVAAANRATEELFLKPLPPKLAAFSRLRDSDLHLVRYAAIALFPFVKTPWNITTQSLRKSPLGLPLFAYRLTDREYRGDADRAVRHAAEQILAVGLMGVLYALFHRRDDKGLPVLTGSRPNQPGAQSVFEQENVPFQSVRLGNQWLSYAALEPYSNPLTLIADGLKAIDQAKNGKEGQKLVADTYNSAISLVRDKTFLQTLGNIVEGVQDAEGFGNRVGAIATGTLGTLVPALWRSAARSLDPYIRDTRNYERGINWWKRQLGGAVTDQWGITRADPRIDLWGRPMTKNTVEGTDDWTASMYRFTSPLYMRQVAAMEPADRLLWNYYTAHPNDSWPSMPAWYVERHGKTVYMPADVYHRFATESGAMAKATVERLIAEGTLSAESPGPRDAEIVKRVFKASRKATAAKLRIGGTVPEGE